MNILNKHKKIFITGTGTGVGKTYVTCQIMRYLASINKTVVAMKPVATGGIPNEDMLELHKNLNYHRDLSYQEMSPFSFIRPISPNIASDIPLTSDMISESILNFIENTPDADYHLIEGVGGWNVPINNNETMADVVVKTGLPVVMVVGMTLGCMNHAILTYNAIKSSGGQFIGWIANNIDPNMEAYQENIDTLSNFIPNFRLNIKEDLVI